MRENGIGRVSVVSLRNIDTNANKNSNGVIEECMTLRALDIEGEYYFIRQQCNTASKIIKSATFRCES